MTDIEKVVGAEKAKEWETIKPRIYYKQKNPYGLIGIVNHNGVDYIASTTRSVGDSFSIEMIRFIRDRITSDDKVCLITDDRGSISKIRRLLCRYGMWFREENNILYSYNFDYKE